MRDPISDLSLDLVIFDLDGVLVDSSPCHARAYAELWDHVGLDGPEYASIAGERTVEVVSRLCAPLRRSSDEIGALVRFKQERARHWIADRPVVFPDAADTVARLSAKCRLAVGTGASRVTAELMLRTFGSAFETIVTAADVSHGKPHPEVYRTVLQRCGVAPERALVIEDSASGLQSAIAAGTHAVVVRGSATSTSPRFVGSYPDLATVALAMGVSS